MPAPRTAIFERRKILPHLPQIQHSWPRHLVTAPHLAAATVGSFPREPHGVWHAREVGSLQTLCGQSAVTWRYFWTLDFRDAGDNACPECARRSL